MSARLLTILGPKGGVGKSTIASNLLVAARLQGIEAAGLDLDSQRSLAGWAETRAAARREPACAVAEGRVTSWRDDLPDAELVVVDTPPGLEGDSYLEALQDLVLASDLVLVPALPKGPTFIKVRDVAAAFARRGAVVAFVLNEADPRRGASARARGRLRRGRGRRGEGPPARGRRAVRGRDPAARGHPPDDAGGRVRRRGRAA